MFVKAKDGVIEAFPYFKSQLTQDCPNVSFPSNISDEDLMHFGVYRVERNEAPVFDPRTQYLSEEDAPVYENGKWILRWVVVHKSAEEIQNELVGTEKSARALRNQKLADCDWTQLNDAPVSSASEWAAYRQALRDVPSQAGFPYDIVWPKSPAELGVESAIGVARV